MILKLWWVISMKNLPPNSSRIRASLVADFSQNGHCFPVVRILESGSESYGEKRWIRIWNAHGVNISYRQWSEPNSKICINQRKQDISRYPFMLVFPPFLRLIFTEFISVEAYEIMDEQHIVIFTTNSLLWLTETAVNPLIRAPYLAKDDKRKATLVIHWLKLKDQESTQNQNKISMFAGGLKKGLKFYNTFECL